MRNGIKAVVFDCHGTIVDVGEDSFRACFHGICEDQGIPANGVEFWDAWLDEGRKLSADRGEDWNAVDGPLPEFAPFRETWPVQFERTFARFGRQGDGRRAYDVLYTLLTTADLYADTRPTLAALRAASLPLGVLSNADQDMVEDVLALHGLEFDAVASSESVGGYKPHRRAFEHIAGAIGVPIEQTLYVGDSAVSDVTGAHYAGMRVAWINRNGATLPEGTPQPHVTLTSLQQILPLLTGQ